MTIFFGKFKECDSEIYIFDSEVSRDAWANYNDEFSRMMGTTAENATFQRQAISNKEAFKLAGNAMDIREYYQFDEINGFLVVCIPPKYSEESLISHRDRLLTDKFKELHDLINKS